MTSGRLEELPAGSPRLRCLVLVHVVSLVVIMTFVISRKRSVDLLTNPTLLSGRSEVKRALLHHEGFEQTPSRSRQSTSTCNGSWPQRDAGYIDERGLRIRSGTFLHMVQGEQRASPFWLNVSRRLDSQLVFLSWKQRWTDPTPGVVSIFLSGKNSSFARGRNKMLAAGKSLEQSQGWLFEFYIFEDEDTDLLSVHATTEKRFLADLAFGDWRSYPPAISTFHRLLLWYKPARAGALPYLDKPMDPTSVAGCEINPILDIAVDAFHRSSVDLILPYDDRFDEYNYWVSAILENIKVNLFLNPYAVKFQQLEWGTVVLGAKHGKYPRNSGISGPVLEAMSRYVTECFPKNSKVRTLYRNPEKFKEGAYMSNPRRVPYKKCVEPMHANVNYASCGVKAKEFAEHWIAPADAGQKCRPDLATIVDRSVTL